MMCVRSPMLIAVGVLFGVAAGAASGALYSVVAATNEFGIGFTGQVDTTADTFMLLSVTDGASGLDFWTISAPIAMNAVDAAGAVHDVPDAWDGTIDSTWGFVGPQIGSVSFNEGTASGALTAWGTGWGGFINPMGVIDTSWTDMNGLNNWPFTTATSLGYNITQPSHDGVTVTLVPAPGALALGGIAAVGRRRR